MYKRQQSLLTPRVKVFFSTKSKTHIAPEEVVAQLASYGFRNLYIDGGATVQRFLRVALADFLKSINDFLALDSTPASYCIW